MHERVADRGRGIKQASGIVWIGRDEDTSAVVISLDDVSGENEASEIIGR